MKVAIVGATGAVGQEFGRILAQRRFPATEYRLLASAKSASRIIEWSHGSASVAELTPAGFEGINLAFFSAGQTVSQEFAPIARQAGALVIDNSSAFRMNPDVPLVIPEVNPDAARRHTGLIANPNCSTIILALVLWPLHRVNPIRRVVAATYQAVSGAGARALTELETQTRAVLTGQPLQPKVFPVPCAFNVFSHDSPIGPDGYNTEETKLIRETHKIFDDDSIQIAPTCLRVPVQRAHTESLSIEFTHSFDESKARELLAAAPGLQVIDDRPNNRFPTPLEASGRDEVLVGRIRQDPSIPDNRGLQLLCAGDQLRKGAALNAIQIAELLKK